MSNMKKTIFSTPVINSFFHYLSRLILKLTGWRVQGRIPEHRRFVLIGAPHTSNWDFILMLLAVFTQRVDVHWMGKDAIFKPPFAGFMRWLGGISIDRSQANNTVQQMLEHYRKNDELIVVMTPEGTRSKVERWKTGFYHIATGAEVPIILGYIDVATKTLGFGTVYNPSGDLEKDMPEIMDFYADKTGIRADLF
jgi:1-acyl-sn-glycerol-3-phosphate acyltransferase